MTLDCKRAAKILRGLEKQRLDATADEIEQLLKSGLIVEADPIHLEMGHRLTALRGEFEEHFSADPLDPSGYRSALAHVEELLKGEWYRIRSSKARIQKDESLRVQLRRAIGDLSDPRAVAALRELYAATPNLAPGTKYVPCPALGVELYALTQRGARVIAEVAPRVERIGAAPLSWLLKSIDKVDGKMQAFARDVAHLSSNIGYVKKRPEQVVIGLMKTGLEATQAVHVYRRGIRHAQAPDVAVTCARNAGPELDTARAHRRLSEAQSALVGAGLPPTPNVLGAAKALLAYDPPSAGLDRFVKLYRKLQPLIRDANLTAKCAARLMPAHGRTSEVVDRVSAAIQLLSGHRVTGPLPKGLIAVAIASMVRDAESLPNAVTRFRELVSVLQSNAISSSYAAEEHALECMACPGSSVEVGAIVRSLCLQLSPTWPPSSETAAIAVSFAKRFAY
ncbi:MAG: hypothetical protein U0414_13535 [Polyangiaceae bacterium]